MTRPPKNMAASVRARLAQHARARREDFQIVLVRYANERLYQRLKRQRSRAMQRLKSLLTTTSPIQLSIGF
ncbi:MAG: hypothetical protein IT374_26630 [Polyangiaceae bacterium]|nr:hypothetical protein [Polyangiaceae bacterium]